MTKQMPRIEHAVMVYRHKKTGNIETRYWDEFNAYTEPEYKHVATLDPALWIRCHYKDAEL